MNAEEYKKRREHIIFPSGLELDITPPSAIGLLEGIQAASDGFEKMKAMMCIVGAGFPEGITVKDINDPKDVAFMVDYVESFFARIAPPESQGSSESSS